MNRHERETYDDMLDGDPPQPCCVCTGDSTAPPCSEECAALVARAERRAVVRGLRAQARTALGLAKRYRDEEGPGGPRERACLDVVAGCRLRIRLGGAA